MSLLVERINKKVVDRGFNITMIYYKPWNNNWSQTLAGFTNMVHSVINVTNHTHCKEAIYVTPQCETCMTRNDHGDPPSGSGSIIFSLQIWNKRNFRNCS